MLWRTIFSVAMTFESSILVRADPLVDSSILKPIHVRDWEAAHGIGLERRASEDFADLDPQTQSHLIYGRPGDDGQLILANMTLYAEDGRQIVMMERFEGLTKAVDCKGDDGSMSLTFKSQAAFEYACETWKYINQAPDKTFLLIANHNGCGPDDERAPYLISSIREDATSLTTFLDAKISQWSEVAGTYDLHFGHATLVKQTIKQSERRGFFDDLGNGITNGVNGIINGAKQVGGDIVHGAEEAGQGVANTFEKLGNVDLSKTVTVPINVGTPGQVINIVDEQAAASAHIKLDCINCFIAGSFAITGRLSVKLFVVADFVLSAAPQDFVAELEMAAAITGFYRPDSLKWDKDLFDAPVPDAGIVVPGILNLGLTVRYRIGVSTTFSGAADFNFGLKATVPNGAQVAIDTQHSDQSGATGWEGSRLDPLFDLKALDASVKVAAFTQPMLVFGVEIVKLAQFDVELILKLPQVQATLTGIYNETGACPGDPSKTGVSLESDVDIELDAQVKSELLGKQRLLFTKPLAVFLKLPLLSKCWPFNIPGLGPATTSAAPAPSLGTASATLLPTDTATPSTPSSVIIATPIAPSQISSTAFSTLDASASSSSTLAPPSGSVIIPSPGPLPRSNTTAVPFTRISTGTIPTSVSSNITPPYPTGSSLSLAPGSSGIMSAPLSAGVSAPYLPISSNNIPVSASAGSLPPYPTGSGSGAFPTPPSSFSGYAPSGSSSGPYPTTKPCNETISTRRSRIRRDIKIVSLGHEIVSPYD